MHIGNRFSNVMTWRRNIGQGYYKFTFWVRLGELAVEKWDCEFNGWVMVHWFEDVERVHARA